MIIVLAAVFGGIWLDNIFGSKPIITFILVFASAPLALFLTFKIAMRSINSLNVNLPPATDGKTKPIDQEEEDR